MKEYRVTVDYIVTKKRTREIFVKAATGEQAQAQVEELYTTGDPSTALLAAMRDGDETEHSPEHELKIQWDQQNGTEL